MYEPHFGSTKNICKYAKKKDNYKYIYITEACKMYKKLGIAVLPLPPNILEQSSLPLCFMYVIHFFFIMYLFPDKGIDIYRTNESKYDDIFIFKFVRDILK